MIEYQFIVTFTDGRKQKRISLVDPVVWSLERLVESIASNPLVQSVDLYITKVSELCLTF